MMLNLKNALVIAGLLASIASASPLTTRNMSKRQIYVEDPFCDAFADNGLTQDDLETLRDLYTEHFGTSGELPADVAQGVCCDGACFSVRNLASRTIEWNGDEFNEAYDALIEEHGGQDVLGICAAPTGGDPYLVSSANRGANYGSCEQTEIFGDTCNGDEPYRGNPYEDC